MNRCLPLPKLEELEYSELYSGTDNQEKDEKQSQNDKTGLGMEKTVKDKAKSKPESLESKVMRECCFVVRRDAWLRGLIGLVVSSSKWVSHSLATLDGLDVGLLEDVIGEDDCDDDDCDEEMSLVRILVDGC
ncbi:hypothetical protein Tco_0627633 [Tanacetum coccineum]|uniref:Uncharacterized protein n=1 Tax=Tanacetum coccineum TaxID=301880 RepID=A0ABQ4WNU3_9ASTR